MIALISAVFVASLLGSMHCAGMCGAFLAFAVADGPEPRANKATLQIAYNAGRLVTYVTLGSIAGLVGAAIDLGSSAVGLQRGAAAVAGLMMIGFGAIAVLRNCGVTIKPFPLPPALERLALRGHRFAASLPPFSRAASIGLLTTLLPCGWLYAFIVTAAGTAHPLNGAITMAVFWLGTLPVMIALGTGVQSLTGALRRHLPLATSLLVVAVGLWTLMGRMAAPAFAATPDTDHSAAIERLKSLPDETPPCCRHK